MTTSNGRGFDFDGKVVLITGAATGIGRAVAVAFAAHGAQVAIGDINEQAVRETLSLIEAAGSKALFVKTDVSQESDVAALVSETVKRFGRLDCAFNNAGIGVKVPRPLAEIDASAFDRTIAVDLRGVFLCMKHELREMARSGRGAIVNTASIDGVRANAGAADYVAAKHGVIGLTKAAAIEYAVQGIRVNALAPGWVETAMTAGSIDPRVNAQLRASTPMGRPGQPDEMAGEVLYLCSDAASYVTGQVHVADGGFTARGMFPIELMSGPGREEQEVRRTS